MTVQEILVAIEELPEDELFYSEELGDGRIYQFGGCEHYECSLTGADLKKFAKEYERLLRLVVKLEEAE